MKHYIILSLIIFYLTSCDKRDTGSNKPDQSEILFEEQEPEYPWSKEVTKAASKAIHQSIKNLQSKEERDENFPANPNNVLFTLDKVVKLEVIGYSQSSATPDIYEIEFRPAAEDYHGSRITVEINIKTKQPVRFFMQADA